MPEDKNSAQTNDASFWDAIETWIPDEKLRDYHRFVRDVKNLPGSDPVLQAILAMGILTVVTRQVPSEVAKELSTVEKRVNELLAAAQQNGDRVMKALQERTAALERLHRLVVSEDHMDAVAKQAMAVLENRLNLYLKPISHDKAAVFADHAKTTVRWLNLIDEKCKESISTCSDLFQGFRDGVVTINSVGKQLQASTTREVTEKLERDFRWRTWMWMAVCILFCFALSATAWSLGTRYQRALDTKQSSASGVDSR